MDEFKNLINIEVRPNNKYVIKDLTEFIELAKNKFKLADIEKPSYIAFIKDLIAITIIEIYKDKIKDNTMSIYFNLDNNTSYITIARNPETKQIMFSVITI